MEDFFGAVRPDRLRRMVDGMHPAIRAVEGGSALAQAFGGIRSVPATILFDRSGKVVLRAGGREGEIGRHPVGRDRLEKALSALR